MHVVEQGYEILTDLSNPLDILKQIERTGRTCYKSEDKITEDSCIKFCKMLINRGHEAVIEHSLLSVRFTTNRAIHNEIVRHRLCSFAAESSRYCNYSLGKFNNEITVIKPYGLKDGSSEYALWFETACQCERAYFSLIEAGQKPEIARDILPLSLKIETVMTANLREWRHFFKLRISQFAHPQMREIMSRLLDDLKAKIPVIFDDID